MNAPSNRSAGLTNKVYEVTNNFETYLTTDYPSQQYISAYIAHCTIHLKMPLCIVKFEFKEHTLFYTNRLVTHYGKETQNDVHRNAGV